MMLNDFEYSREVIDMPISVDTWVMGTRPGLVNMLLAGCVIGPWTRVATGRLTGEIAGIRAETLAKLCITWVVVLVLITLEIVASIAYVMAGRACTVFETDLATAVRANVTTEL